MARTITILLALLLAGISTAIATAQPVDDQFLATWQRTDQPVADGQASRT